MYSYLFINPIEELAKLIHIKLPEGDHFREIDNLNASVQTMLGHSFAIVENQGFD